MKAVPEKAGGPAARPGSAAASRVAVSRTTSTSTSAPSPSPSRRTDRRALQQLQGAAGNRAVSRLVAQRYTAPVKPSPAQAAGFRKVKADVAAKKTKIAVHPPAAGEAKASQDAAVAPPDDKEAQGKAANAEKMNEAKPGEFDKKAFVDAVNKAIDAQAPKNLDEADKFSKSGKADQVKAEVDGKVTDGKESSAKDIDTATQAPPDTSAAKEKEVTPLTPDQAPANPGAPSAADAIPEKQPPAVTDFSEGPAQNDQAMADAEVTEEQLAKGNEPEFNEALSAKKTSEADAAKAPAKGRAAEDQQLATAKEGAAASGAQAMTALTATRSAAGKEVDGGKGDTKTKDEKKRAEVTAKLQKVYDGTKKDVEETLSGLDKKVDTAFTAGEKAARDAFTADHKRRMKKYKDKRYSGWTGKARWVKDKFAGMPEEANNLYQEARKLYVSQMQTVISSVADIIGTELGRAKARIAKGRAELAAEVDKLPADLKQFGEEAAKDFAGKFDDLEATVNEKSEQLVQDLATKYTAALNKIDEEIKKLQEANRGLIDKAKDAIVGAIKTINELKNLLLGILAKAASAIMKIIKDPIGFLRNLVTAVGAGLNLFITNIGDHLKTGVVSWLLGTAVKAGLELPQRFDIKGIIQIIGSLLGLTWDNIRARVTRKGVPDEAMSKVESSVPVAQSLAREGPAGAVKEIQAETGDLKATILSKLTTYLIPTVIIAGITWILSLLNPASAFVRAVKGIIDIVTFIVTQGAQIIDFVNAVLDAVIQIANGGQAGVPKLVEAALAASVPLLIGFLAALLGIGGLANKVKSVFQSVSRPVTRAIDKIVDLIARKGKALWSKLKKKPDQKKPNPKGAGKSNEKGPSSYPPPKKNFESLDKESHKVQFNGRSADADLVVHSSPQDIKEYMRNWKTELDTAGPAAESGSRAALDDVTKNEAAVKSLNRTFLSRPTGSPAKQDAYEALLEGLAKLADVLARRPGAAPPLPPPVLPPFEHGVLAQPFKASYIDKDIEEGSDAGTYNGATLTGWNVAETYNTTADRNAWVKMHLLPAFLGGDAKDSNLVPARGFVNNPLFLWAVENPAMKSLNKAAGSAALERMIWYKVNVSYYATHPGFPERLAVEWGGYDHSGGTWTERSPRPGNGISSFADTQDPPAPLNNDVLRINLSGVKYAVYDALGIGRAEAESIKNFVKKTPLVDLADAIRRFPHLTTQFTNADAVQRLRFGMAPHHVLRINVPTEKYAVFTSLNIGKADAKAIRKLVKSTTLVDLADAIRKFPHLTTQLTSADAAQRLRFD
ncbi:phage tail protein [Streptomyces niveus]|uniref:phage tail protein n=1 Tax=Streptomyces niveus TaxID=193462 RepID=UPI0036ACB20A